MSAKIFSVASCFVLSIVSLPAWGADTATVTDLRRAVPADVHMAVYAKRNPERDYQREYLEEAWETVQEEQIGERILEQPLEMDERVGVEVEQRVDVPAIRRDFGDRIEAVPQHVPVALWRCGITGKTAGHADHGNRLPALALGRFEAVV